MRNGATQNRTYFEKFPAGHYEVKISYDRRSHGQVDFHALEEENNMLHE